MTQAITLITAIIDFNRVSWNEFGDYDTKKHGYSTNPYKYNKENYLLWFSHYVNFTNEMYIYVDEPYFEDLEYICRNNTNMHLIKINKKWLLDNLPVWRNVDRVREIMQSEHFKKLVGQRGHFPEASVPEYVTMTHSKLEFVIHAMDNNLCKTDYVSWVDFGMFKDPNYLLNSFDFNMSLFPSDKIVVPVLHYPNERDKDIVFTLQVARDVFCGGLWAGTQEKMREFNNLFKAVVETMHKNGITDDEQHVLIHCYYQNPSFFSLIDCKGDYRNIFKNLTAK